MTGMVDEVVAGYDGSPDGMRALDWAVWEARARGVPLTARLSALGGGTIKANRELLAPGTANVGSGLVHGFPVSSSATRKMT